MTATESSPAIAFDRPALGFIALGLMVASPAVSAQSIAARVGAVENGAVRMSFTAREGVCGGGRNIMTTRSTEHWESACDPGPVRVVLEVRQRDIVDVDTYVGGQWRVGASDVTDLGTVPATQAADFLLGLAERIDGRAAKEAILAATLADSAVVWPRLLDIAQDPRRPRRVRKSAVFWVAQAAADAAVSGLEALVEDEDGEIEVRESAIFALSQLKNDEGVPVLIRVVKTNRDPRLTKKAIFWLGQSHDPRAIALLEELLLGR